MWRTAGRPPSPVCRAYLSRRRMPGDFPKTSRFPSKHTRLLANHCFVFFVAPAPLHPPAVVTSPSPRNGDLWSVYYCTIKTTTVLYCSARNHEAVQYEVLQVVVLLSIAICLRVEYIEATIRRSCPALYRIPVLGHLKAVSVRRDFLPNRICQPRIKATQKRNRPTS